MTLGPESCTGSFTESQVLVLGSPLRPMRGGNRAAGGGAGVSRKTEASCPSLCLPRHLSWEAMQRKLSVSCYCCMWEAGVEADGSAFQQDTSPRGTHVRTPSGRTASPLRPRVQPDSFRQTDQSPPRQRWGLPYTSQVAAVTVKPRHRAVCQLCVQLSTLDPDAKQQPCETVLPSPLFRGGNRHRGLCGLATGHSQ